MRLPTDTKKFIRLGFVFATIVGVISIVSIAYFGYMRLVNFQKDNDMLIGQIAELEKTLASSQAENQTLAEALYREQGKNAEFAKQIEAIAGTVGVLDKLSKTDKELLQKYSKVYFLNEHFTPKELAVIDKTMVMQNSREEKIHAQVLPFLEQMIRAGEKDGVSLRIISAYRSFETQANLKSTYTVTYGTGANRFSADQGYSEHQLGTAVDFTTKELGTNYTRFGETKAYDWLTKNAHRFGFILSYPENNAYYVYEPWHWRFVGTKLAKTLYNEKMNFYDMEQRNIDPYLISIFD